MLDFCGLRGSKHIYLYLPLYLHDLYWTLGQRPHCVLLYHKLLKPTKGVEIVPNNKLSLSTVAAEKEILKTYWNYYNYNIMDYYDSVSGCANSSLKWADLKCWKAHQQQCRKKRFCPHRLVLLNTPTQADTQLAGGRKMKEDVGMWGYSENVSPEGNQGRK